MERPMAVTRSWTIPGSAPRVVQVAKRAAPPSGVGWLVCASLFVAAGLAMVYAAKQQSFAAAGRLVDLNRVASPQELLPILESFPDRAQRESLAQQAFGFLERHRPLRNVGALAALHQPGSRHALFPLAKLKPLMAVRSPDEFRRDFLRWSLVYFAGFYAVALVWAITRFRGDRALLPALHLLSGIGLCLMASMRDPLRDTLEFHKFALGVFLGCLLLALPALKPFAYRRLSDWCYTPLFAALALFGLLLAFGKGPTGNDAKVNLGPFQPVELIKILLVLFMAGYFTRHWERLRDLREKRLLAGFFDRAGLPRLEHIVPVACAVAMALVFFFVLKDLGPALVTFFVFLAMFGVARGRPGLAAAGVVVLVASVAIGYQRGSPHTVVDRINMWLSPWDND
ncbi:MAG TPA: FtsW/RodA/SpoVE family cell cycle protein, partial [Candidatus Sulfopaludibacter sp.]|nr:FtsW/RodA/SpoVE family cell cycle protein [Candidatus Sulfopaludibacter sp.]